MTRVRIENASYLLTVDDTDRVVRDATVVVEDGFIAEVTAPARAGADGRLGDDGGRAAGDLVIDARGKP